MRIVSTLALTVLLLGSAALADWPQYQGPDRNGIAPNEKNLARSWPEGGPKEVWKTDMLSIGYAGAIISDGKIYVLDRIQAKADVFRCLNLQTGAEEWQYEYAAPGVVERTWPGSRAQPIADDKHVYAIGPFGHFHCFDKKTHEIVYKKNILADYGVRKPVWGVAQNPLIHKNMIIVGTFGSKAGAVAWDKDTGKEIWRTEPGVLGNMAYSSPILATVDGVEMVVVYGNGEGRRPPPVIVSGLDASNGKVLWKYDGWNCGIPIASPTPIGDGRFFLTAGYRSGSAMFKVTRDEDGAFVTKELFKTADCGSHIHNALLYKGHLYANSNDNRKGLVCMDLDGKVKWESGDSRVLDKGNLLIADGLLFIMEGEGGNLRLVDPTADDYKELAKAKVISGEHLWATMAISDGMLIVRDHKQMKCLDVRAAK